MQNTLSELAQSRRFTSGKHPRIPTSSQSPSTDSGFQLLIHCYIDFLLVVLSVLFKTGPFQQIWLNHKKSWLMIFFFPRLSLIILVDATASWSLVSVHLAEDWTFFSHSGSFSFVTHKHQVAYSNNSCEKLAPQMWFV